MFRQCYGAALVPLLCLALISSGPVSAEEPAPGSARWIEVEGGAWVVPPAVAAGMAAGLEAEADRHWGMGRRRPLGEYTIQYQGQRKDGQRSIRLGGACSSQGVKADELKKRFRLVFDGGTCFFDATYDPEAGRFLDFAFHGYA